MCFKHGNQQTSNSNESANEFYCWRCKQGPFDRSQTKNCYECGWDICPKCGACVSGCSRMKVERPSSTTEPIKNQNDDSELGIMIMVLLIAGVFIIIRVKDSDWYTSRDYKKKSKIYDSSGFNCYGVHRNGTRYDENGYNQDGFDANGYDANGYNQDGFDVNGYDANGYDKSGYNKSGYDRRGFDRFGYGKSGYNRQGYDKFGYNRAGYNQQGYNKLGYKRDGFDANGYDSNGYNKAGFDVNGYDSKGFDKDGYNKDGINALGKKRPNKYIEINSKQISKKDLKPDKFGNITCPYCKSKVTTYWKRCPKCDEPFDFLKD